MSVSLPRRTGRAALGATVLGAVLSLAGAGVAAAAPVSPSPGADGVAATGSHCARAPKALKRIATVESRVTTRLPKLQAAEKRLTAAGRSARAGKVEKRIARLQKVESRAATLAKKIAARCPQTAGS